MSLLFAYGVIMPWFDGVAPQYKFPFWDRFGVEVCGDGLTLELS